MKKMLSVRTLPRRMAAQMAGKSGETIRQWCRGTPGLAMRDERGYWQIDAEAFLNFVEKRASETRETADRVRAELATAA